MNVNHFRRNVSNYATVVEDAICNALIAALIQVLHENEYFRCSTANRLIYLLHKSLCTVSEVMENNLKIFISKI